MNVAIYKPNSKNNGCAFSFRVSTQGKSPVFYVNAIQQYSWDDNKKTGSFIKNKDADDKNVSFKLNDFELGEILSSIKSRVPWNGRVGRNWLSRTPVNLEPLFLSTHSEGGGLTARTKRS